jgi:hypothetical protein
MYDQLSTLRTLLETTDRALATEIDANWIESQWNIRGAQAALFRRYTQGDHDAKLTDQMKNMLRVKENDAQIDDFVVNYCNIVIEKFAARLHVNKFDTGDDAANQWVLHRLNESRFMANEGMFYRGAARDASAFAIIDPQTLTFKVEPSFDGYSGVVAIYDNDGNIQWAAKIWHEATGELINMPGSDNEDEPLQVSYIIVYQPDKLSAWIDDGSGAKPYAMWNGESELDWKLKRIPVFQFTNKKDSYNYHGESELRAVVPLQNMLNRTLHSTGMVEELGAFPINVIIGAALNIGALTPGSIISMPLKDSGGNIITNPTPEQLDLIRAIQHFTLQPADLDKYLNALEKFVVQIAQVTETPIYGVTTAGNLSGEALKQLEIGLIGKCERFQRENTDTWREIVMMLRDIQQLYATPGIEKAPKFDSVSVVWKSPEVRDNNLEIATLINLYEHTSGLFPAEFYRQRIGVLLDMSEDQIKKWGELAEKERALNFANILTGGNGEGGMELV